MTNKEMGRHGEMATRNADHLAEGSITSECRAGPQEVKRGVVLGIDPGICGAWALLDELGNVIAVDDLPVAGEGTRRMIAGAVLADLLRQRQPSQAVIERVGAMPGQGVSSTFKFGQAVGTILGVMSALSIPIMHVAPQTWKKHFGLPAEKEICRQRALERWPASAIHFSRRKDHGRAEAAFLAAWGLRTTTLAGGE